MKVRITSIRDRQSTKELLIGYQINGNGSIGYLSYSYISLQKIILESQLLSEGNVAHNNNTLNTIASYIKVKEDEKEKRNEEKANVKEILVSLIGQEVEV